MATWFTLVGLMPTALRRHWRHATAAAAAVALVASCGAGDERDAPCERLVDEVRAVWNRDARSLYEARIVGEKNARDDLRWFDAFAADLAAARAATCRDQRDRPGRRDQPGPAATAACLTRALADLRTAIARPDFQLWPELQPVAGCREPPAREVARISTETEVLAVLAPGGDRVAMIGADNKFRVVDLAGKDVAMPDLDPAGLESPVAWLPDGRLVAMQRGRAAVFGPTGKKLASIPLKLYGNPVSRDFRQAVIRTALGLEIASLDEAGPLIELAGRPLALPQELARAEEMAVHIVGAFSPDGSRIAVQIYAEQFDEIRVRDLRTGRSSVIPYRAHILESGMAGLGWLDDHSLVVGGSVRVAEVAGLLWRLRLDPSLGLAGPPEPIVRSPADVSIAVADSGPRFILLARDQLERSGARIRSDGSRTPLPSLAGFALKGIDSTGRQVLLRRGPDSYVSALDPIRPRKVAVPSDLRQVMLGLDGGRAVGVGWKARTWYVFDERTAPVPLDLAVRRGEQVAGLSCAASSGCLLFVVAGVDVRLFRPRPGDPATREVGSVTLGAPPRAWTLDPAGRQVAFMTGSEPAGTEIEIYDLETHARRTELVPCLDAYFLAFAADGRQLRTSCADGLGFSIVGTDLDHHSSRQWFTGMSLLSGLAALDADTVLVSEVAYGHALSVIEAAPR